MHIFLNTFLGTEWLLVKTRIKHQYEHMHEIQIVVSGYMPDQELPQYLLFNLFSILPGNYKITILLILAVIIISCMG